MTCKGTNMGNWGAIGQGGNGQWSQQWVSISICKRPFSEGSTNLLCIKQFIPKKRREL